MKERTRGQGMDNKDGQKAFPNIKKSLNCKEIKDYSIKRTNMHEGMKKDSENG